MVGFSSSIRARVIFLAVMAFGFCLGVTPTYAVLEPDDANDTSYKSLGAEYSDRAVWFQFTIENNQIGYGSGVLLDPTDVLTAAHFVPSSMTAGTINMAGSGTNYLTDLGKTVGVKDWIQYPEYTGSFTNSPDIAIIHLTSALGSNILSITSAAAGQSLIGVGFGHPGTPTAGILPADGNSRGWRATVDPDPPDEAPPTYYFDTDFGTDIQVSLNGKALSGDSGGPWFDDAGGLVGLSIAQTGGTSAFGTTTVLNLDQPEIHSWITANTSVPEPTVAISMAFGCVLLSMWRRHANSA